MHEARALLAETAWLRAGKVTLVGLGAGHWSISVSHGHRHAAGRCDVGREGGTQVRLVLQATR